MTPECQALLDWPHSYGRIVLDEVGSTLDAALRQDKAAPFWLLARHQTAARGRRGRVWQMPRGNFAATLMLRLDEPPDRLALRSFVMSLALFRALAAAGVQAGALSLKWPNDVLLNGGKLAGILLESDGSGHLAIGVGVNLLAAPDPSEIEKRALRPVSVFGETGLRITPETFLDMLAHHYAREEARLRAEGFAALRCDWLNRAAMLGEPITARLPNEEIPGRFDGIDDCGHLLLQTGQGLRTVAAGDIHF